MAFDELFSFHENLSPTLLGFDERPAYSVFFWAWVLPGTVLALIAASLFLGFLWRLPRKTRLRFVGAGSLFITGALGMEIVAGAALTHGWEFLGHGVFPCVEELLEMTGVACFVRAVLLHWEETVGCLRVVAVSTDGGGGTRDSGERDGGI